MSQLQRWTGENLGPTALNNQFWQVFNISLLNLCRALEAGTVSFSSDTQDAWGEAYVDIDGRNGSVSAISDNIAYDNGDNKYFVGDFSGTVLDSGDLADSTGNDENNAAVAITNDDTVAKRLETIRYQLSALGGVVSVQIREGIAGTNNIKSITGTNSSGLNEIDVSSYGISLQPGETLTLFISDSSNRVIAGSTFNDVSLNDTTIKISTYPSAGYKLNYSGSTFAPFSFIDDAETDGVSGTITHDVPAGTFNAAVSSLIAKALVTGDDPTSTIEHKVTNASDDSGYLDDGEVSEFTIFTGEVTKVITQLTAASSGATPRTPSISSMAVRCV